MVSLSSCEPRGQKELANLSAGLPEGLVISVREGKRSQSVIVLAFMAVPPKWLKTANIPVER